MSPTFGISTWNNGAYGAIEPWLKHFQNDIEIIELSAQLDPDAALLECAGLILPGGGDPAAHIYGMEDPEGFCNVDANRDKLELSLITTALEHGKPILGICRGFQLMNVALGGTLILDLPAVGIEGHHPPLARGSARRAETSALSRGDSSDAQHPIHITPGSHLHTFTGLTEATVNSNHHQGIGTIAPLLTASAAAPDGVIEALEWNNDYIGQLPGPPYKLSIPTGNDSDNFQLSIVNFPFLLLVHWHPERMEYSDPCSKEIAESYIAATEAASRQ